MGSNLNKSYLAQQVIINNFVPQLSGKIVTSGTSSSYTFTPLTGTNHTTFKITNKGSKGAYIGWGVGSATAVATSTTGNGVANADYIGAGAIITQDFQSLNGIVDTIAAIQGPDTQDNDTTTLEISMGFGQ